MLTLDLAGQTSAQYTLQTMYNTQQFVSKT